MPSSPSLLILAAGMGSRYGGLKQIDAVGPSGEALVEYAIFDALRAGFGNVVCVIRRDIESRVKRFFESRLPRSVRIDYALQEVEDLPGEFVVSEERPGQGRRQGQGERDREKPWGTGQAVLAAEALIEGPFLMINADDFYGREAFALAFRFLVDESQSQNHAIIGYPLSATLSDHGPVSRGICHVDADKFLQQISEEKSIFRRDGAIVTDRDGNGPELSPGTLVSMNMLALRPSIFARLRSEFMTFLQHSGTDLQAEFQLPDVLNRVAAEGQARIHVLPTTSEWFGMTCAEDRAIVVAKLQRLVSLGVYPSTLWHQAGLNPNHLCSVFHRFETGVDKNLAPAFSPVPAGHIHDTFQVSCDESGLKWLLQRINHDVFPDVVQLMDNIERVTRHLQGRTTTLCYSRTVDDQLYYQNQQGNDWRLCQYIDHEPVAEGRCNPELAAEAGRAFGEFLALLHDLAPDLIAETIPDFHRLSWRLKQFDEATVEAQFDLPPFSKGGRGGALQKDLMKRVASAREEIEFINSLREEMLELEQLWNTGQLPQRITHNDTKLTNVLFDKYRKAICVIDLDTVMPGLVHFDFGDALRTIANTAAEDATDPDTVSFDRDLAAAFIRGYIGACGDQLTRLEVETLWRGPGYMTFIMGLRFLADYLAGDNYYKIDYPDHNLVRARAQLALLCDMRRAKAFLQETISGAIATAWESDG